MGVSVIINYKYSHVSPKVFWPNMVIILIRSFSTQESLFYYTIA